jgi:hypothetical protein
MVSGGLYTITLNFYIRFLFTGNDDEAIKIRARSQFCDSKLLTATFTFFGFPSPSDAAMETMISTGICGAYSQSIKKRSITGD